jgi:SAM-dependent methyltransferase
MAKAQRDHPERYLSSLKEYSAQPFEIAVKAPALRDFSAKDNLNVLEIGARADISLPKLLTGRMATYISVDIDENPAISTVWARQMYDSGLSITNTLRIAGFSGELPIKSGSQDLVYASCVQPFIFANSKPLVVKDLSLREAHRVLKPGGQLMLRPFNARNESAGRELIEKYFKTWQVHRPSPSDLIPIAAAKEDLANYEDSFNRGYFLTLVATKS